MPAKHGSIPLLLTALCGLACSGAGDSAVADLTHPGRAPTFQNADGLVGVGGISAQGCVETKPAPDSRVECHPTGAPGVVLYAEDATISVEDIRPAQDILTDVRLKEIDQRYDSFTVTRGEAVTHDGHTGWEIEVQGTEGAETKNVRERVVVMQKHVLTIGAEGTAEDFQKSKADIASWFASVQFATLRDG